MPLIYACITPHAGDLIDVPDKIASTRKSMNAMGVKLEALKPDLVVIIDPHGFRVSNAMNIAITDKATAEWSPELKLDFDVHTSLANAVAGQAESMSVPVVRSVSTEPAVETHVSFRLIGERLYLCISWGMTSKINRRSYISAR